VNDRAHVADGLRGDRRADQRQQRIDRLPGDIGAVTGPPFTITDTNSLLGWNIGTYVQDEWKLTNQLTLNSGFASINCISSSTPTSSARAPRWSTSRSTAPHPRRLRPLFHAAYQAQATQSNIALFANTTNQPDQP
jgi:hypothetical protein